MRRAERACGISERRRPVKTSAKLATWRGVGIRKERADGGVRKTYLELLLRLEHFGERLAGADAQRVA